MKIEDYVQGALGLSKAALGIERAPREIIMQRREICLKCEHRNKGFNKLLGGVVDRCELCKCIINAKTLLKNEKCPDTPERWVAIQ